MAEKGDFSHFEQVQDTKSLVNVLETINTIMMSEYNEKLIDTLINYETILLKEVKGVGKYKNKGLTLVLETQRMKMFEACKRSARLGSFQARNNLIFKTTNMLFVQFAELVLAELEVQHDDDYDSDEQQADEIDLMPKSNLVLMKASQAFTGASDRMVDELISRHFVGLNDGSATVNASTCKSLVDSNLVQKLEAYKSLMSSHYVPVYKLTKFRPDDITGPIAASERRGRQIFTLVDQFTDYIIGDEDAGNMFLVYNFISLVLERSGELCARSS